MNLQIHILGPHPLNHLHEISEIGYKRRRIISGCGTSGYDCDNPGEIKNINYF